MKTFAFIVVLFQQTKEVSWKTRARRCSPMYRVVPNKEQRMYSELVKIYISFSPPLVTLLLFNLWTDNTVADMKGF